MMNAGTGNNVRSLRVPTAARALETRVERFVRDMIARKAERFELRPIEAEGPEYVQDWNVSDELEPEGIAIRAVELATEQAEVIAADGARSVGFMVVAFGSENRQMRAQCSFQVRVGGEPAVSEAQLLTLLAGSIREKDKLLMQQFQMNQKQIVQMHETLTHTNKQFTDVLNERITEKLEISAFVDRVASDRDERELRRAEFDAKSARQDQVLAMLKSVAPDLVAQVRGVIGPMVPPPAPRIPTPFDVPASEPPPAAPTTPAPAAAPDDAAKQPEENEDMAVLLRVVQRLSPQHLSALESSGLVSADERAALERIDLQLRKEQEDA